MDHLIRQPYEHSLYNTIVLPACVLIVYPFIATVCIILPLVLFFSTRPDYKNRTKSPKVFGFFHPYCSGGGGGERVLWKMIQILQQSDNEMQAVIYTIDPPSTDEAALRKDAEQRFNVRIEKPVQLVSLEEYKDYLKPAPYLSLVLESWGTMKLAHEGLKKYPNIDVFCDTTGCAFTFAVARRFIPAAYILAYVHYPTISTDMMLWEWSNPGKRSKVKTIVKLVYYWLFSILYGLVGSLCDLVLVNSTWTYNHIKSLWKYSRHNLHIVYPPCRVPSTVDSASSSSSSSTKESKRSSTIVSIGQFRPEKNHALQVEALAKLFEKYPIEYKEKDVQLLLIGSCRNDRDKGRVEDLKALVERLDLKDAVTFSINPPYSDLQQAMTNASIGIHTMRQEHFGIGIVEMMAAGLLTIAHNSGGPKSDIIQNGETGFLAITAEEYADAIHNALSLDSQSSDAMRGKAQVAATRFSDEAFDESFGQVLSKLTSS